jgi:predicted TIM-barrel fold metal-dependent hydrolase
MDYGIFDADNHYYEAEDAFLRYADEKVRKHVRWVSEGKRRFLLFGNSIPLAIPNPTFNPVSKPGSMQARLKQLATGQRTDLAGEDWNKLEPISPTYRERDARLMLMDEQGLERVFLWPTLGQSIEPMVTDDPDLMYRCFRAFNEWLNDDWGFDHDDRIYAPPVIPLMDVNLAVIELERVMALGAKAICLRSGPVYGRSPADPYFDPFWARMNEAGILCAYHAVGGPVPYPEGFKAMWYRPTEDRAHMATVEATIFPFERPAMDSLTALILGNFFGRFPNMKVAVVEMGGSWASYLMHSLDHAGGITQRTVTAFGTTLTERPSEILKRHVWISPFPEEDVVALTQAIGVDHVLMGSDWPHAEGTIMPADYVECLDGLDDASIKKVMRDNALSLIS